MELNDKELAVIRGLIDQEMTMGVDDLTDEEFETLKALEARFADPEFEVTTVKDPEVATINEHKF